MSSDMKSATDTVDTRLARALVKGFLRGCGIPQSKYISSVLSMIGPRRVHTRDKIFVTRRGVMMGECMAKPILTLLNLCVEELAYLRHTGWPVYGNYSASPHYGWRFFHVGGDDHLAFGPICYLNKITKIHKAVGSIISEDKHAISRIAVTYCERMIYLPNLQKRQPYAIAKDHSDSVIVDSVKVRLLSKGLSTQVAKDEKNVAIGKARQLAGCLRWLPRTWHWPESHKVSIRDLFIRRMRGLLPSRHKSPSLYAQVLLPLEWGGLDLYLDDEELYRAYTASPYPTLWVFWNRFIGEDIRAPLKKFRRLNTNNCRRGVPEMQQLEDDIVADLEMMAEILGSKTWPEIQELVGPTFSHRETKEKARDLGWMSFRDFAEYCARGDMFTTLLLGGIATRKNFNTIPLNKAYRILWNTIVSEFSPSFPIGMLTKEQFLSVVFEPVSDRYFCVENQSFADFGRKPIGDDEGTMDFRECTFLETFTIGKPTLIIESDWLGAEPRVTDPEGR